MTCDLGRIFGGMRTSLPKDAHSTIIFSTSSFNGCPERVETDRLVLAKSTHEYGSGYRTDLIKFHAKRETFQELGLLILAIVFQPGGYRTHVELNHPLSIIKNLVVSYSGLTARSSGHKTKPDHFSFSPGKVEKHPWKNWGSRYWPLSSFPSFRLTNMREFVASEADWASRDTVLGFGDDDANIRLADLLLNIGYSDESKIVLEGEGGNRGVGLTSAEAAFEVCEDLECVGEHPF
jgi:hypothetical protein